MFERRNWRNTTNNVKREQFKMQMKQDLTLNKSKKIESKWSGKYEKYKREDRNEHFSFNNRKQNSDGKNKTKPIRSFNKPIVVIDNNKKQKNQVKNYSENEYIIDISKESIGNINTQNKKIINEPPWTTIELDEKTKKRIELQKQHEIEFLQKNPISTPKIPKIDYKFREKVNTKSNFYIHGIVCLEDLELAYNFYKNTKLSFSNFIIKYSMDRFIEMDDIILTKTIKKIDKALKSIENLKKKKNKNKGEVNRIKKELSLQFERKQIKYYNKFINSA